MDIRNKPIAVSEMWVQRASVPFPPVKPSWATGEELFEVTVDKNMEDPFDTTPLAFKFSSPFTTGTDKDSLIASTITSYAVVDASTISRSWKEIVAYPPTTFWKARLSTFGNLVQDYYAAYTLKFAACITNNYVDLNSGEHYTTKLFKLEVKSGANALIKQDFCLTTRPAWGSSAPSDLVNKHPALGGFSVHEADLVALTDEESYNLVRKRVVVIAHDLNQTQVAPFNPSGTSYRLSTDPARQLNVTADGVYWGNMYTSVYNNGTLRPQETSFFVYPNTASWVTVSVFIGEFSLKQFHDYITETDNYYLSELYAVNGQTIFPRFRDPMVYSKMVRADDPSKSAGRTGWWGTRDGVKRDTDKDTLATRNTYGDFFIDLLPIFMASKPKVDYAYSSDPTFINNVNRFITLETGKAFEHSYAKDSYYHQIKSMVHSKMVRNGVLQTPKSEKEGIFSWDYIGLGKVEAYTFDGAAPTPYKPVYLLERDTGRLIRETVSDGNGKYVLHAIPTGIEYIAVSVDQTRVMNAAIEEFGVILDD